jgi:hypothetical protein
MTWAARSTNRSTSSGGRNDRRERDQRRLQRRAARRKFVAAVAVGALILLMFPGTRGVGLMILVLGGLGLYVIARRKRA